MIASNIATDGARVAVALRDVGSIQARRFNTKRGWIIAGIVFLVGIAPRGSSEPLQATR